MPRNFLPSACQVGLCHDYGLLIGFLCKWQSLVCCVNVLPACGAAWWQRSLLTTVSPVRSFRFGWGDWFETAFNILSLVQLGFYESLCNLTSSRGLFVNGALCIYEALLFIYLSNSHYGLYSVPLVVFRVQNSSNSFATANCLFTWQPNPAGWDTLEI